MSLPLISVVIPCYNQNEHLNQALMSLADQEYKNFEVVVVDDGSDIPITLEQGLSFPITLIRQKNQGLANARNTGYARAKGSLIKFLDADDTLLPKCLALQVFSISQEELAVSIIGFQHIFIDKNHLETVIPAFSKPLVRVLFPKPPQKAFLMCKIQCYWHQLCTFPWVCNGPEAQV